MVGAVATDGFTEMSPWVARVQTQDGSKGDWVSPSVHVGMDTTNFLQNATPASKSRCEYSTTNQKCVLRVTQWLPFANCRVNVNRKLPVILHLSWGTGTSIDTWTYKHTHKKKHAFALFTSHIHTSLSSGSHSLNNSVEDGWDFGNLWRQTSRILNLSRHTAEQRPHQDKYIIRASEYISHARHVIALAYCARAEHNSICAADKVPWESASLSHVDLSAREKKGGKNRRIYDLFGCISEAQANGGAEATFDWSRCTT